MKVVFSFFAHKELEDTIDYYELQSPGLGERFKDEVKHGVSRIKAFPRG